MNPTLSRIAGLAAALTLGILIHATGPAAAIPDPGPVQPATSSVHRTGDCPLERVGHQLVRCDDLTGAGVRAPAWVPERAGR